MKNEKTLGAPWRYDAETKQVLTSQISFYGNVVPVCEVKAFFSDDARLLGEMIAELPRLADLVSRAYDRFTDADFVPPNGKLLDWLTEAQAALLAIRRAEALAIRRAEALAKARAGQ